MSIAEKALQEWIKTQSLPVSDVEEHGFINGYNWATAKTLTEPSVKEITELWLYVVNNKPVNDKRPIEWHFANAILRKAQKK